ncbi:unnamed protein product, partial [Protopolystoma xenopodis]
QPPQQFQQQQQPPQQFQHQQQPPQQFQQPQQPPQQFQQQQQPPPQQFQQQQQPPPQQFQQQQIQVPLPDLQQQRPPPNFQQPPANSQAPSTLSSGQMPPMSEEQRRRMMEMRDHLRQMRLDLEKKGSRRVMEFENEDDYPGMPNSPIESIEKRGPGKRLKKDKPKQSDETLELDSVFLQPSVDHDGKVIPSHMLTKNQDAVGITVAVRPGTKDCFFYTPIADFEVNYQFDISAIPAEALE